MSSKTILLLVKETIWEILRDVQPLAKNYCSFHDTKNCNEIWRKTTNGKHSSILTDNSPDIRELYLCNIQAIVSCRQKVVLIEVLNNFSSSMTVLGFFFFLPLKKSKSFDSSYEQ
jgi:hypothetical protein